VNSPSDKPTHVQASARSTIMRWGVICPP
jgi:hypothetical protein